MGLPFLTSIGLAVLLAVGTVYSVRYSTYLDTSNPLLSYAPHPLSQTHYFASKRSSLNTIFIKNAWGWTTAVFFLLFSLASKLPADSLPPPADGEEVEVTSKGRYIYRPYNGSKSTENRKLLRFEANPTTTQRTLANTRPLLRWAVLTAAWAIFTAWFFGPALLTRLALATGGECVLVMPPLVAPPVAGADVNIAAMAPRVFVVPDALCYAGTPIGLDTHPALFTDPATPPSSDPETPAAELGTWDHEAFLHAFRQDAAGFSTVRPRPRVRRGHDVSGHVFLLTVGALFLAELLGTARARLQALEKRVPQVAQGGAPRGIGKSVLARAIEAEKDAADPRVRGARNDDVRGWNSVENRVLAYKVAVGAAGALYAVWLLSVYVTGVYFHTPFEKLTGFALGVATYGFSRWLVPVRGATPPAPEETPDRKII